MNIYKNIFEKWAQTKTKIWMNAMSGGNVRNKRSEHKAEDVERNSLFSFDSAHSTQSVQFHSFRLTYVHLFSIPLTTLS